jgi:signal transduction histidine kinase
MNDAAHDGGPAAPAARALMTLADVLAGDLEPELLDLRLAEAAALCAAGAATQRAADPAAAFAARCAELTAAGWGSLQVVEFDRAARQARVRVGGAWEARLRYPPGCPLLRGLLSDALRRALAANNCWAEVLDDAAGDGEVMLLVRESNRSFATEADRLHRERERRRERDLERSVQERARVVATERRELEVRQNALLREWTRLLRQEIVQREQAERFKDELITTVNHELRTPLASIRGFAELLVHRELPAAQRQRFLQTIERESARLSQLIDDFLDLARLEERLQDAAPRGPVDLVPLLHAAAERFAVRSRPVELDAPPVLPTVCGRARRLEQVLTNLVGNACKFTPPDKRVVLHAHATSGEVVMSVQDEGPGIPADAVPKLFTRFFRADDGSARQIGGTGLGLAIVKQIVQEHGGRVWVESTVGAGSRFFVALPRAGAPGRPGASSRGAD